MALQSMLFRYQNADGEISERELKGWREGAFHIIGMCTQAKAIRTFRKSRILDYFNGCEKLLEDPFAVDPEETNEIRKSGASFKYNEDNLPVIQFTGFKSQQKEELQNKAIEHQLHVPKSKRVVKSLTFLCIGENAGPSKVKSAKVQKVCILTIEQFHLMLETGELPEE